jgi:hypothetical protein
LSTIVPGTHGLTVEHHEANSRGGGKTLHAVFKYFSRSLLWKLVLPGRELYASSPLPPVDPSIFNLKTP